MSIAVLVLGLVVVGYLLRLHWQVWLLQQRKPSILLVAAPEQPQRASTGGCLFQLGILSLLIIGFVYLFA